jgi:hypothetical protein
MPGLEPPVETKTPKRARTKIAAKEPAPVVEAPSSSAFAEELALIKVALEAQRAGRIDEARAKLAEHAQRFPSGQLTHERQRIEVMSRRILFGALAVLATSAACEDGKYKVGDRGDTLSLVCRRGGECGKVMHSANKLDLLLMVDNSGSMREEQVALAAELPRMLDTSASCRATWASSASRASRCATDLATTGCSDRGRRAATRRSRRF